MIFTLTHNASYKHNSSKSTMDNPNDPVQIALDSVDVLTTIMSFLTEPEICGLRYVNKQFNEVGLSNAKIMQEKREKKITALLADFQMNYYINKAKHGRPEVACKEFMLYMEQVLKTDWTIFIRDIPLMEEFFKLGSYLHTYMPSRFRKGLYDNVYNKIRPYLYLDREKYYTIYQMKEYARFKGIPRAYKMNRSQLRRVLTRPKDEVYLFVKSDCESDSEEDSESDSEED